MINDSVREELATRISARKAEKTVLDVKTSEKTEPEAAETRKPNQYTTSKGKQKVSKPVNHIKLNPSPKNVSTKPTKTAEIVATDTNRTLVEFQSRKKQVPEWRLQLQNLVQQRQQGPTNKPTQGYRPNQATAMVGAVASPSVMDVETIGTFPMASGNDQIANALKRIEQSRNKYLIEEPVLRATPVVAAQPEPINGNGFPFAITGRTSNGETEPAVEKSRVEITPKPTLVPPRRNESKDLYDTSELEPEFVEAKVSTSFEKRSLEQKSVGEKIEIAHKNIKQTPRAEILETAAEEFQNEEAYDDFAPLALRFNAGVFDLIIGSFGSLLLLAPFILLGGSWLTIAGFFGFLATFAIVMFIYFTTTIGIFGKTVGMRLFSLEMIDIGGEEYPTFHQSAVSSSVFLLSLAMGGTGFLTSFFDEERRAVHDLVSGTIIVKEF